MKSTIATGGTVRKVKVFDSLLMIADGKNGIGLYSLSDPLTPALISTFDTDGDSEDIALLASDALVADGYGGLKIINISTPSTPLLKSEIYTVGDGYGVDVVGDYAFIADFFNGLVILDISNPLSPAFVAKLSLDYNARDVALDPSGKYAYLAVDSGGLTIVDVSDKKNPLEVSRVQLGSNPREAFALEIEGSYAFIAAHYGGLFVVDISDPVNPLVIGSNHFGDSQSASQAKGVAVKNNIAVIANGTFSFAISDISDLQNPANTAVLLSDVFPNSSAIIKGDAHDVKIRGSFAYMAHNGAGLAVIDISTPSAPDIVQEVTGGLKSINSVQIVGDTLYATNSNVDSGDKGNDDYVVVWDLTTSPLPQLPDGSFNLGGQFPAMAAQGNYLFLAGEGFKVLDVTNPLRPHQ